MPYSKQFQVKYLWLIPLLLALAVAIASAADTGTIKLKTGEEYKDVSFTVNDNYKTIQFESGDKKLNASFSDIESITDQNGQDVTARVMGKYYKPVKETWVSSESKEIKQARAKPWNILLNLGGNYSIPAGNYYKGIDAGFGFDGDLRVAVNNKFAIQLMVSKSGMKLSNDIQLISIDPRLTILNEDLSINVTRYEVALNFFQPFSRIKNPRNLWYGYSGLGMAAHVTSTKATFRNNTTGEVFSIDVKDTQNKFALVFGFGAVAMVSKGFGFDFSGSLDMVAVPTESNEPGQNLGWAYIFDIKIGAMYVF
jgi:hypothetical protein